MDFSSVKLPHPTSADSAEVRASLSALHFTSISSLLSSATSQLLLWSSFCSSSSSVAEEVSSDFPYTADLRTLLSGLSGPLKFVKNCLVSSPSAQQCALSCSLPQHLSSFSVSLLSLGAVLPPSAASSLSLSSVPASVLLPSLSALCNSITGNGEVSSALFPLLSSKPPQGSLYSPSVRILADLISTPLLDLPSRRLCVSFLAASLHNLILALPPSSRPSSAIHLASDKLLVSNLLRSVLPPTTSKGNSEPPSTPDAAAEWTTRLFHVLIDQGALLQLWRSCDGPEKKPAHDARGEATTELEEAIGCTAECVVLASVLASHADESLHRCGCEGIGDVGGVDETKPALPEDSLLFLSRVACFLSDTSTETSSSTTPSTTPSSDVLSTQPLICALREAVLDSLATYLSLPSLPPSHRLLLTAQPGHPLVPLTAALLHSEVSAALSLAADKSRKKNDPQAANERLQLVSSLLRLLANVCYGCREAQDALGERGLFAVLSASSLGVQFLAVRELSVVAIRNALEGHEDNQRVVERLKAIRGAENDVTDKMGVRVKVDEHGKVNVEFDKDQLAKGGGGGGGDGGGCGDSGDK